MQGILRKMETELSQPIKYVLPLGDKKVELNPFIGKLIKLTFTGHISCIHCQKNIKKSFAQGYCYPCFSSLPQCDLCIMKPETCHYDAGTCRDPDWGDEFCFQPHYVYLSNSSAVKVGITRETQVPTRWIDQGAVQALPICKVKSRYISGLVEVAIAEYVSDRTSWQRMLKNLQEPLDLVEKRDELLSLCETQLAEITEKFGDDAIEILSNAEVVNIQYPAERYPEKVKSFNFDKTAEVTGVLQGIKGQYLLLDSGVINIRKFTGYNVEFSAQ
jgi:hypothetical protein